MRLVDPGRGKPFRTVLDFDATEQLRELFPFLSRSKSQVTPYYSKTLLGSLVTFPVGGFASATVTPADIDVLSSSPLLDQIDLSLTADPAMNQAFTLTEGNLLRTAQGRTGGGVKVAVIDGNIRTDHPSLSGSTINEFCFSSFNACSGPASSSGPGTATHPTTGAWAHGTGVTGIIASSAAPAPLSPSRNVEIFAYRTSSQGGGAPFVPSINLALDHIVQHNINNPNNKIKVVNLSFSLDWTFADRREWYRTCDYPVNGPAAGSITNDEQNMRARIDILRLQGVLVVASTGNKRLPSDDWRKWSTSIPACFSGVISATSVGDTPPVGVMGTNIAAHQRNLMTKIAAPGEIITSPWTIYDKNLGAHVHTISDNVSGAISGTSFAAPNVASCIAQLSQTPNAYGNPEEIRTALIAAGPQSLGSGTNFTPYNDATIPLLRCSQVYNRSIQPVKIGHYPLSGTWYDPASSGNGFVIEVNTLSGTNPYVFGGWYTYNTAGGPSVENQRWLVFDEGAAVITPSTTVVPLVFRYTTGGLFNMNAGQTLQTAGTGTLKFESCDSAILTYSNLTLHGEAPKNGTIVLRRLLPTHRCHENDAMQANIDSLSTSDVNLGELGSRKYNHSGTWANSNVSFEGMVIEINPSAAVQPVVGAPYQRNGAPFISWYVRSPIPNAPEPRTRWLTLQERLDYTATTIFVGSSIYLDITQTTNSAFMMPAPLGIKVGEAVLSFSDVAEPGEPPCHNATLTWEFNSSAQEFANLSGTSTFKRVNETSYGCTTN